MTAKEREAAALRHVCPVCRAGVGQACLSQSKVYSDIRQRSRARTKHPHAARVAKVVEKQ